MIRTIDASDVVHDLLSPYAAKPKGLGWELVNEVVHDGVPASMWFHRATGTQVLSSMIFARLPRSGKNGPQWLVSVVDRKGGRAEPERPSTAQIALARCAFGVLAAEEDNHHPGKARHLFMPVDPRERVDCECKADEVVVTDFDGYQWTNPVDENECRGCDLEHLFAAQGRPPNPCPIHKPRLPEARP